MGAKVPRYTPHGYSVGMRATHEGGYVRWHDYEALEAKLREAHRLLRRALPYLEDVTDEGPDHEGWKSSELITLIGEISATAEGGRCLT